MDEALEEKLNRIFCKAIARALGAMEIENCGQPVKAAVKSYFWDVMGETLRILREDYPKLFK